MGLLPYQRGSGETPTPSTMRTPKAPAVTQQGSSPEHDFAGTLILDLQPPWLWEINFYCLEATQSVLFCDGSLNGLAQVGLVMVPPVSNGLTGLTFVLLKDSPMWYFLHRNEARVQGQILVLRLYPSTQISNCKQMTVQPPPVPWEQKLLLL